MSILANCFSILFSDIWSKIIILIVCSALYKLSNFYLKVWSLPPGPFPLPLIGNILLFRVGGHFTNTIERCAQKYGPVFTFWMGDKPFVFIADLKIAKDSFRQIEFSGRPDGFIKKWFSNNNKQKDIAFIDYGPTYGALRAVTLSAIHKYTKSEEFLNCLNDCVETTIREIIEVEGVDKQFGPKEYIHQMIFSFMFKTTFGREFKPEDQAFEKVKTLANDFSEDLGTKLPLWESSPLIRLLNWKTIKRYEEKINNSFNTIRDLFKTYEKDYNESNERNICDAVITARNKALREDKSYCSHLNDNNLSRCMADILVAGSDTTANAFIWELLFMTYYPKIQQKLRQEINNKIGEKTPTLEDRNHCNYVMAFIAETLRIRNIAPIGVPHKTLAHCKIENFSIPTGTTVCAMSQKISTDEKYWPNGQQFKTERFLENGKYTTNRSNANIPFGIGRRMCLGDRFAQANLFLTLVRFLQLTMNYDLVLGTNESIEPDPNQAIFLIPKNFNIILRNK